MMKTKEMLTLGLGILLGIAPLAFADYDQDVKSILSMTGCYKLTFDFNETYVKEGYPFKSAPYHAEALEWISAEKKVDKYSGEKIVLQHILLTPQMPEPLKHWSQEWIFQPHALIEFQGHGVWEKRSLEPSESMGVWAERVLSVDDSPRYECAAAWTHTDSKHFWDCQTWSPLPRREGMERGRRDYDILVRGIHEEITSSGWVFEQSNSKVKKENASAPKTEIARENGQELYERVSDSNCANAQKWWEENKGVWSAIQAEWADIYASHSRFQFQFRVNGQFLWQRLSALAEEAHAKAMSPSAIRSEARKIIESYLTL